jgi:hypothetical protein
MDPRKRLASLEDGFTERKPNGTKSSDLCRAIVAFANSVPEGRTGILFIGVGNTGEVIGVENTDSTQKTIRRLAEKRCYPPIAINSEVLHVDGKNVVAIIVSHSKNKPHFSGPAFIRVGSESVEANAAQFEELIASRNSKAGTILSFKGKTVTIKKVNPSGFSTADVFGFSSLDDNAYRVVSCTAHYVNLCKIASSKTIAESLENVTISYDNERYRPMLVIRTF